MGKDLIIIKNEASLPITHIGTLFPTLNIQLLDVLVVPLLTKNIISISKLIFFFLLFTFIDILFFIQNFQIKRVVQPIREMKAYIY
jgi:hypothetical protein